MHMMTKSEKLMMHHCLVARVSGNVGAILRRRRTKQGREETAISLQLENDYSGKGMLLSRNPFREQH
jgi:hypothetical protein